MMTFTDDSFTSSHMHAPTFTAASGVLSRRGSSLSADNIPALSL